MTDQPPNPRLLFCPYLPMQEPVTFAGWELGPLQSFEDCWADHRFKIKAKAFLDKFVGTDNKPIDNPALLCRQGQQLNGEAPSREEVSALELALVFAFVDRNPRGGRETPIEVSWMVTADNAELYEWPIDVEEGRVALNTGYLVETKIGGYKISDPELALKPPLDLHMPKSAPSPDPLVLTGVYETVLQSLRSPGESLPADRVRVAVEWFAKAWHNTRTVEWPERLVYLKTAFEAVTGYSDHESAHELRRIFEELRDTAVVADSEILVWSPEEKPGQIRCGADKCDRLITYLEAWFKEFGDARNTIIHEGQVPKLMYSGPSPAYNGHFFFTAEFMLRGVIKVLLSKLGYDNVWRLELWRTINATLEE